MARPAAEYPTELELQILKILWERSPLPVRDVRLALADQGRELAHTSVITTLNTMVGKKSLRRSMAGNACLFAPRLTRDEVSRQMLEDADRKPQHADLFGPQELAQAQRVHQRIGADNHQPGAVQQRPPDFKRRGIERHRGQGRERAVRAEAGVVLAEHQPHDGPLRHPHPLRLAGRG